MTFSFRASDIALGVFVSGLVCAVLGYAFSAPHLIHTFIGMAGGMGGLWALSERVS